MDDDEDAYESGLKCDECGGQIDPEDEDQYSEHTGWYFCPHCGHNNMDE
jgi:DNA-directed RNA polymerase subunit RPC12/RpoP